jgi:transcriptional regulator GlxA family with amidase domain
MKTPIPLGILLFDGVEVLDFAGPFEVFSLAETADGQKAFDVKTVSETGSMITAAGGLKIQPEYSFKSAPNFEVLIVPGGYGARVEQVNNPAVLDWLKVQAGKAELIASVCTGAFLLAKAGLLEGRAATTHWAHTDELKQAYPGLEVRPHVKFVDQGKIITSGGISAGINMSFYIVKKLVGRAEALESARQMEYDIVL